MSITNFIDLIYLSIGIMHVNELLINCVQHVFPVLIRGYQSSDIDGNLIYLSIGSIPGIDCVKCLFLLLMPGYELIDIDVDTKFYRFDLPIDRQHERERLQT